MNTPNPKQRYLGAVSSDMVVEVENRMGSDEAAVSTNAVSYCSECGCLVYRTDLHDAWHDKIKRLIDG